MANVGKWVGATAASVVIVWFVANKLESPQDAMDAVSERRRTAAAAKQRQEETRVCTATEEGFTVTPGKYVDVPIQMDCWSGMIKFEAPAGAKWLWEYTCWHCKVVYSDGKMVERNQPYGTGIAYFSDTMPAPYYINVHGEEGTFRVKMWLEGHERPSDPGFYRGLKFRF